MLKDLTNSTGLSSGLLKATPSGSYQRSQAIAPLSLSALKTTGLNSPLRDNRITQSISTLFMTAPTSIKMGVLSAL